MSKKIQIEQETESKIGKLFRTNYKDRKFIKGAGFICILILTVSITGIPFLTSFKEMKSDPEILFAYVFGIILLVFAVFLLCMYKLIKFLFEKQSGKINNYGTKIIEISNIIFKQRAALWKDVHSGNEENNLLKSLVYPASSLYSVTAFIIGKDQKDNPTHMLFMIPKNENNNNKIYEVLGQRMPVNSLPHCFVKSLVKKYVDDDYQNDEIKFSKKFHEKEETVDNFTKTVPLPYRIQEECNIQFGGNPFHLDHIYVLEIQIKGLLGLQQADLVAIWIDFEKVKQICKNVLNPKVYGETSVDSRGKEYIKFESQRKLAVDIIDKYLPPKK